MDYDLINAYKNIRAAEVAMRDIVINKCTVQELVSVGLEVDAIIKHRKNTNGTLTLMQSRDFINSIKKQFEPKTHQTKTTWTLKHQ